MLHRSAAKKLRFRSGQVDMEWLPAYAPDLNPAEQVWNHSKYAEMTNFIPGDVNELYEVVAESLCNRSGQKNCCVCFSIIYKDMMCSIT